MKNEVFDKQAKKAVIRCFVFFVLLFSSALTFAQTRGKLEVIKDPLIDTLTAKRATLGKNLPAGEESAYGYRVQIYMGSNRQIAYAAQARFLSDYPEYRTYITYIEPNFKVQAGDFRTRLEAQKLMSELTQSYPSLFIIPGKINPPKADTSND